MMKKLYIRYTSLWLSLLLLIFSVGCAESSIGVSTEHDSPKVLTPEEIESIFAEVSFEEIERYPSETDENGLEVVYWLEGGSVWHISQACSTIKKADTSKVKMGSVQDALNNGKERPCKICGENFDYSAIADRTADVDREESSVPETEKYLKEYGKDGKLVVFWLENGKVWHESRYCASLSRSDPSKIIHGLAEDAIAAGKERACKNCSD